MAKSVDGICGSRLCWGGTKSSAVDTLRRFKEQPNCWVAFLAASCVRAWVGADMRGHRPCGLGCWMADTWNARQLDVGAWVGRAHVGRSQVADHVMCAQQQAAVCP